MVNGVDDELLSVPPNDEPSDVATVTVASTVPLVVVSGMLKVVGPLHGTVIGFVHVGAENVIQIGCGGMPASVGAAFPTAENV